MSDYMKVIYAWNEPRPTIEVPSRLRFESVDEDSLHTLIDAVRLVMEDSHDRSDHKEVAEHGAQEAARRFVTEAKEYFGYELSWWQLAYDKDDALVGFVQPVTFPNCQKDGLEEASIYYMGVLPTQRGHGYAYDLLCKNTQLLQELGVWRIFCDTDVENAPMIASFERAGYERGEINKVEL